MVRLVMMGLIVASVFAGCTAKEVNAGVDDAADSVVRVIRGTNN